MSDPYRNTEGDPRPEDPPKMTNEPIYASEGNQRPSAESPRGRTMQGWVIVLAVLLGVGVLAGVWLSADGAAWGDRTYGLPEAGEVTPPVGD